MTHFELFEVAPGFQYSKKDLTRQYVALQKRYHPDYFGQADEEEQASMEQLSTQVNEAYNVLQNEDACIKYYLQLHQFIEDEEKYTLEPLFLMEVMELNELKMEGADETSIRDSATDLMTTIRAPVSEILSGPADLQPGEAVLKALKNYYYQKKYLDRLLAK